MRIVSMNFQHVQGQVNKNNEYCQHLTRNILYATRKNDEWKKKNKYIVKYIEIYCKTSNWTQIC